MTLGSVLSVAACQPTMCGTRGLCAGWKEHLEPNIILWSTNMQTYKLQICGSGYNNEPLTVQKDRLFMPHCWCNCILFSTTRIQMKCLKYWNNCFKKKELQRCELIIWIYIYIYCMALKPLTFSGSLCTLTYSPKRQWTSVMLVENMWQKWDSVLPFCCGVGLSLAHHCQGTASRRHFLFDLPRDEVAGLHGEEVDAWLEPHPVRGMRREAEEEKARLI